MKVPFTTFQVVFVCGMLSVSACSSITEGTDQNVTILSDPSGASCVLSSQNGMLGIVNPTPGSIVLSKSKDDVTVTCKKDGYQTSANSLKSDFENMTFGNLIFGGFIGLAVDASTGAINKYPTSISVILMPDSFPSEESRDRKFDQEISKVKSHEKKLVANIQSSCSTEKQCAPRIKAVEAATAARLADLEEQRLAAKIDR